MLKNVFMGRMRIVAGMCAVIWQCIQVRTAHALSVQKPSIMQGGGDMSQIDSGTTSFVQLGLYVGYSLGALALLISLLMCLPFIGQTQKGLVGLKSSSGVIIALGLFHFFVGYLGGAF